MSKTHGQAIVRQAINLLRAHPDGPALSLLDRAMKFNSGNDPCFASFDPKAPLRDHPIWSDDLEPPSPFAELLPRAFAPEFDPMEAALMCDLYRTANPQMVLRVDAIRLRWQHKVLKPFAYR